MNESCRFFELSRVLEGWGEVEDEYNIKFPVENEEKIRSLLGEIKLGRETVRIHKMFTIYGVTECTLCWVFSSTEFDAGFGMIFSPDADRTIRSTQL